MRLLNPTTLFICLYSLLASCNSQSGSNTPKDITLSDIIAQNTKALGGAQAIDATQNITVISQLKDRKYLDSVHFMADRMGRMRIDIYNNDKRVYTESFDGTNGHQWSPQKGQSPASEKGTVALSHTPQLPGHIFQLKDLVSNGHKLALVDQETIDDTLFYVLKLTLDDGFEVYYYVHSESMLITRSRSQRALHVDVDSTVQHIEVKFENYRKVQGVLKPYLVREVDLNTDSILMVNKVYDIRINLNIPESTYDQLE